MIPNPLARPLGTTISVLERAVKAVPDKIAFDFSGHQLTYAQFDRESTRLAHALRDMGLERGRPLALMLDNNAEDAEYR